METLFYQRVDGGDDERNQYMSKASENRQTKDKTRKKRITTQSKDANNRKTDERNIKEGTAKSYNLWANQFFFILPLIC